MLYESGNKNVKNKKFLASVILVLTNISHDEAVLYNLFETPAHHRNEMLKKTTWWYFGLIFDNSQKWIRAFSKKMTNYHFLLVKVKLQCLQSCFM